MRHLVWPALVAGAITCSLASAQSAPTAGAAGSAPKPPPAPAGYMPTKFSRHASEYYQSVWGVDSLSVKLVESGELVRFSWRVIDPRLAKAVSDKKAEPSLEDPQAGVSLVVPTMENIGQLRQTQAPEAGRSYWMTFSNSGRPVKHGHRVNVVVGSFRANGLIVE
jgi:hypothetical protein